MENPRNGFVTAGPPYKPPPQYISCNKYINLYSVTEFWKDDEYGWIVTLNHRKYVVDPKTSNTLETLSGYVDKSNVQTLFTFKMDQIISKLDALTNELQLLPEIGRHYVKAKRKFEETIK